MMKKLHEVRKASKENLKENLKKNLKDCQIERKTNLHSPIVPILCCKTEVVNLPV